MKTLIVYYSWSGNTKRVAEKIHAEINDSDLVEIKVSENTFSQDMYKTNDIFHDQLSKNQLPKIDIPTTNFNAYDLILVGVQFGMGCRLVQLRVFWKNYKITIMLAKWRHFLLMLVKMEIMIKLLRHGEKFKSNRY